MRSSCLLKKLKAWVLLLAAAWAISIPVAVRAQTANNDPAELKRKIAVLVKQGDHIAALPLLEKIVVLEPADHEMHFQLGMALMAQTTVTQDADERKALRIRAREAFIKAQKTGDQHPIVDALIGVFRRTEPKHPGFLRTKPPKT